MRIFALLTVSVLGLMFADVSHADRVDCRRGVDHPHPSCRYVNHRNHYSHNYYRNYHNHGHHRRRSDNDDWAWALGGLILGAAIANNANENQVQSQPNTVALPPPQQRRVTVCSDEVAYDASGKPYVLRTCTETMR